MPAPTLPSVELCMLPCMPCTLPTGGRRAYSYTNLLFVPATCEHSKNWRTLVALLEGRP